MKAGGRGQGVGSRGSRGVGEVGEKFHSPELLIAQRGVSHTPELLNGRRPCAPTS